MTIDEIFRIYKFYPKFPTIDDIIDKELKCDEKTNVFTNCTRNNIVNIIKQIPIIIEGDNISVNLSNDGLHIKQMNENG
jgi:hypothetical protein